MGLVQNLKKKLNALGDKILVELSCLYIRQLAKQTTKKQDNSSLTTFSQNPLTAESPSTTIATSSAGTSEKIIMEIQTENVVSYIREWAIERVGDIHEKISENKHDFGESDDAYAIYREFAEWIEPETSELEIMSLDEITEEEYDNYIDGIERS